MEKSVRQKKLIGGLLLAALLAMALLLTAGTGVAQAAEGIPEYPEAPEQPVLAAETEGEDASEPPETSATVNEPETAGAGPAESAEVVDSSPAAAVVSEADSSEDSGGDASLMQYGTETVDFDHDGDGRTEIGILYNYGDANTGLWLFDPTATGFAAPQVTWASGAGNWDWTRAKLVATDHNGDGNSELTVLYNYGNSNSGLWIFDPDVSGYTAPRLVWSSGNGNWEWSRSKLLATDFNGDGSTELSVLYDYGDSNTGLWLFDPTPTGFLAPRVVWASGAGNWKWANSKLVSSDVDGNGATEIGILYNYGNDNTGLWLMDPAAGGYNAPRLAWTSGYGNWSWANSKLASTDHDGDGRTEITILYNYGNSNTGIWLMQPSGAGYDAPQLRWASGYGNWDWTRSKLLVTDYDGDGRTELAVLYNYGNALTGLWLFDPDGAGFAAPRNVWASGAGNWDWTRSKLPLNDSVKTTYVLGVVSIDINLSSQVLTAIAGVMTEEDGYIERFVYAVFSTLVSTGGPGSETPTGFFSVYSKNLAIDMSGPGYYAPAVPFTMWFTGPYSIHGTYWHNDFGWPHTHGCVNLPTPAAQWVFERTPVGTPVWVHY